MNNFSIKDIERLSGIKAHTLRIWEHRHGLCFCKRKESHHRYYDNEDLKQILRIAYLYHNGYKVSKIAKLSTEEIRELASVKASEQDYDLQINQLVEASLDYDQPKFESVVNAVYAQLGFESSVIKVFYPYFEKIGLLWMTEHVIPAHEHFSSYLIQKKIIVAINELPFKRMTDTDIKVAIFAPKGEHHEIPLLVMQYLLKKRGIPAINFGCNVSESELVYYAGHHPVTHVFMHVITNFCNKEPDEVVNALREKLQSQTIIVSGPAFMEFRPADNNIQVLRSCSEMFNLPSLLAG